MQTSKDVPLLANPIIFTVAWFLSGALTVIMPMSFRNRKVDEFIENSYYEGSQDEENDQWEEAYNVTAGTSDCKWWNWGCNDEDYYIDEDGNEIPTDELCSWYQWNCTSLYYNKDGELESRDDAMDTPGWFNGWGTRMQGGSNDEENEEATPAMKFVYGWTVLIFIGILIYGAWTINKNNESKRLLAMLILFANFSVLSMFLVASGGIETEGRELESKGFFGQFGVLIFLTNFWQLVFCVAFAFFIFVRNLFTPPTDSGEAKTVDDQHSTTDDESTNYFMMGEPVSKKKESYYAASLLRMESQSQDEISFITKSSGWNTTSQVSAGTTHRSLASTNKDCCDVLFLPPSECSEPSDSVSTPSILPSDSSYTEDDRNVVSDKPGAKDTVSEDLVSDDTIFDGCDEESSVVEFGPSQIPIDTTEQKPKKRGWKKLRWCMPLNGCQRESAKKPTENSAENSAEKSTENSAPRASSSASRLSSPSASMTLGEDEMLMESSVGLLRIQPIDQ